MLTYLIETVNRLALPALCLGLLWSYSKRELGKSNVLMRLGFLFSLVLALTMTYFKTFTVLVDTSLWNVRNFWVSIVAFVLLIVFLTIERKKAVLGHRGVQVCIFILVSLIGLYHFPYVMEMPYTIYIAERTFLSTSVLQRMLGVLFGIILSLVLGISVCRGANAKSKGKQLGLVMTVLGINTVKYIGLALGIMITKRMITSNTIIFKISVYTTNYSTWFIYLALLVCVVLQIGLIIASFTEKEPYENPAQRRKIIAKWRLRRRWAVVTLICSLLVVLTLTVIKEYDSREAELSPVEETLMENGNMYVSFEQVADGALHRYAYTTENGVAIRFIVIQKPNSSAYGIGLDACEICGETGYYQKDGLVICNLCDVVMNINTIGFKGGCNPIPIDYSIENGYIVVPIEGLLEYESEFK